MGTVNQGSPQTYRANQEPKTKNQDKNNWCRENRGVLENDLKGKIKPPSNS